MEQVKPNYLGKVLPPEKDQMTKFLDKQYDAFNTVYDACKSKSAGISDLKNVSSNDSDSLSVKVSADTDTMEAIKATISSDEKFAKVSVSNDTLIVPNDN
jgi:hypothetical protein